MILVDADSLVYKAGWSVEKRYYTLEETGEVFKTKAEAKEKLIKEGREGELPLLLLKSEVTGSESHAVRCLDNLYKSILEPFKGERYVSYLSGPNNFRHEIAVTKPYKGNRSSSSKPYYYDMLRTAICEWFNGEVVDWIEADDRIAIEATADAEATIVGIDKDLLQIPGRHYNYDKGQFLQISDNEGWYNFFTQVLTGDPGDNIPGLPGVGRAGAMRILSDHPIGVSRGFEACRRAYEEIYGSEEQFEEVCGLLYLLRYDGDSWAVAREWVRDYGG